MSINELIKADYIICNMECQSKKRVLENAATHLSDLHDELDSNQIFSALIARERLGSTGLGNGIAIPHCHISGITQAMGLLITLAQPIDFDAIDSKAVDVLFVLVVPDGQEQQHLETLAAIVERFSNQEQLTKLRKADSTEQLHQLFLK